METARPTGGCAGRRPQGRARKRRPAAGRGSSRSDSRCAAVRASRAWCAGAAPTGRRGGGLERRPGRRAAGTGRSRAPGRPGAGSGPVRETAVGRDHGGMIARTAPTPGTATRCVRAPHPARAEASSASARRFGRFSAARPLPAPRLGRTAAGQRPNRCGGRPRRPRGPPRPARTACPVRRSAPRAEGDRSALAPPGTWEPARPMPRVLRRVRLPAVRRAAGAGSPARHTGTGRQHPRTSSARHARPRCGGQRTRPSPTGTAPHPSARIPAAARAPDRSAKDPGAAPPRSAPVHRPPRCAAGSPRRVLQPLQIPEQRRAPAAAPRP